MFIWLVVYQLLWKIWKSVGMMKFPTEWKNKTASKPPTSYGFFKYDFMGIQWDTTNAIRRSSYRSGLNSASIWPANIGALTHKPGVDNWRMVILPIEMGNHRRLGFNKKVDRVLDLPRGPSQKKKTYSDSRFRISGGFPIGKISQITLNKPR